jgi:hypothetical protein
MTRALALLVVLAACPHAQAPPRPGGTDLGSNASDNEITRRQRWVAELQDDILSSYERDDLPDVETQLVPPTVGPARIGVGPGDVLVGDEVKLRASSRWPLYVGPDSETTVRSKRLDIHLALDASAAWTSDEVSWRITLCNRVAVIPLRVTALYAHDGDRWVQVFEHLSFGTIPEPQPDGSLFGVQMPAVVVDRPLADELSRVIAPLLYHQTAKIPEIISLDPMRRAEEDPTQPAPTLLLAPDPEGEWHGELPRDAQIDDPIAIGQAVARAELAAGALHPDDRRIGTVGPSVNQSTIAYWVGNFVAELPARLGAPAGKVRLRGTFVFEKRKGKWLVVQGHVSQPVDDFSLARTVFGTALAMSEEDFLRKKPLAVTCEAGLHGVGAATVPAAAPTPSPAPAAGTR